MHTRTIITLALCHIKQNLINIYKTNYESNLEISNLLFIFKSASLAYKLTGNLKLPLIMEEKNVNNSGGTFAFQ